MNCDQIPLFTLFSIWPDYALSMPQLWPNNVSTMPRLNRNITFKNMSTMPQLCHDYALLVPRKSFTKLFVASLPFLVKYFTYRGAVVGNPWPGSLRSLRMDH